MNEQVKKAKVEKVNCIRCGKKLDTWGSKYQPSGGVMFSSGGNYGSTVFDPCGTGYELLAIICDECVKILAQNNHIKMFKTMKIRSEDKWYSHKDLLEYLNPNNPEDALESKEQK